MQRMPPTNLDTSDPLALPARLTTREVLALARYSRATLTRRRRTGLFPEPIERGVYVRDQVLQALRLLPQDEHFDQARFQKAADAFHRDRGRP